MKIDQSINVSLSHEHIWGLRAEVEVITIYQASGAVITIMTKSCASVKCQYYPSLVISALKEGDVVV